MKGGENVVHLAFTNESVAPDSMAFIACAHCRNKTFTLTEDQVGWFPLVRCAACGAHIGRAGWYDEEDEAGSA